ncbi:MAG: ribose-phosphate pyrophosphokinase [Clostridiales bacterium]|jgi:ribose-phosphate pyrophosphokinase|nr:ribose-phosphate pyrophosphokinase [Clostridiales bacterium]
MTTFTDYFDFERPSHPVGIIAMPGAEVIGKRIDEYLVEWYNKKAVQQKKPNLFRDTFLINAKFPRFATGDGKAVISETVRGLDLYIIADVGNYHCTYKLYGNDVPMSPDEHFADLKRVISAAGGKPERISVIMPILYGGRQHRRNARESLDCAMMLQELHAMGVKEFITFDAHDPRVQNAVPLMGFDNFFATYQMMKALHKRHEDFTFDKNHCMIVSPDEGAMGRNIYYASVLGLDLGMFYKRRDYSSVVDGRNPIVSHEYIGSPVMGMDVFVADDIIATGESMLHLAGELKSRGANRVFALATYALFTAGLEAFDEAYAKGDIAGVISTNLTYTREELQERPWYIGADLSKYIAYIIAACNQNKSVSALLEPVSKINELIGKINSKRSR